MVLRVYLFSPGCAIGITSFVLLIASANPRKNAGCCPLAGNGIRSSTTGSPASRSGSNATSYTDDLINTIASGFMIAHRATKFGTSGRNCAGFGLLIPSGTTSIRKTPLSRSELKNSAFRARKSAISTPPNSPRHTYTYSQS